MANLTLRPPKKVEGTPDQTIAAQALEIEQLKAARNVPNTAAADMAGILDFSNTALQSEKHNLQVENAALIQQVADIAGHNSFLEIELASAAKLLRQTIPDVETAKLQNSTLQTKIETLQQEKLYFQHQNTTLRTQNTTLEKVKLHLEQQKQAILLERDTFRSGNVSLQDICRQWGAYSNGQGAELTKLKEKVQELHGSLVRKTWRLHIQQTYLDRAGLVVNEFEAIDDDVIRAWAAENLVKTAIADGIGGNGAAVEAQITPVETTFAAVNAKAASAGAVKK